MVNTWSSADPAAAGAIWRARTWPDSATTMRAIRNVSDLRISIG
jgi:hypothetical protein